MPSTELALGNRIFPLLADPRAYVPCAWELTAGSPRLHYWVDLFRRHFVSLLEEAAREEADRKLDPAQTRRRTSAAQAEFHRYLDEIDQKPDRFGRLDILTICIQREVILRRHDIVDPYRLPKTRENQIALAVLPQLLAELEALPEGQRLTRITQGIFAGNIFDLGATQTAELFIDKSVDFHAVRKRLAPRPWLIDDFDAWIASLGGQSSYRAAALFVDNAGADVVLGMLPLARELLRRGTNVILTANTTPTLNDITHDELGPLVRQVAQWDAPLRAALEAGRLELVASGNGVPLIDLRCVSDELVEAVERRGVDLVVIEGMGRAVESNLDARFACDVLKIAMVKDRGVAEELGGKLYDLVLRFDKA